MERTKALNSNSGQVDSYGWDAATLVLEVAFASKGGKLSIYTYSGVPYDKWEGLQRAVSAGKYLHSVIIPNYACQNV